MSEISLRIWRANILKIKGFEIKRQELSASHPKIYKYPGAHEQPLAVDPVPIQKSITVPPDGYVFSDHVRHQRNWFFFRMNKMGSPGFTGRRVDVEHRFCER